MMRVLKWTALVLGVLAVVGFGAFLYLIPPFTLIPPEEFIRPEAAAAASLEHVSNPVDRALAERGKYLVTVSGCAGCHTTPGPQGPQWDMYLAGGMKFMTRARGTVVSRNLTPDLETGIGRRTGEELALVFRSGVLPDGRAIHHRVMPWPVFANWTEEDRHAVIAYLRHLKPVRHRIPDPDPAVPSFGDSEASEMNYGTADYGVPE